MVDEVIVFVADNVPYYTQMKPGDTIGGKQCVIASHRVRDGDNDVEGSTTDAPASGVQSTSPATIDSLLKSICNRLGSDNVLSVPISINSSGDSTIFTPTSGKAARIAHLFLTADSEVDVIPKMGGNPLAYFDDMLSVDVMDKPYLWKGAVNDAFVINLDIAVSVSGFVLYYEE